MTIVPENICYIENDIKIPIYCVNFEQKLFMRHLIKNLKSLTIHINLILYFLTI